MVNVRYCYVSKNQSKAPVDENLTLQVVPPGVHFVAVTLNGAETQKLWDRTITIHDRSELHPLWYSTRFQVYEITYKAGIGQQRRWSADAGSVVATSSLLRHENGPKFLDNRSCPTGSCIRGQGAPASVVPPDRPDPLGTKFL